jgi:mono/diheme cytochrome c family protein
LATLPYPASRPSSLLNDGTGVISMSRPDSRVRPGERMRISNRVIGSSAAVTSCSACHTPSGGAATRRV